VNIDRVHADIEAGRAWKALDRLQGMRSGAPADQEVLELIGRLRADMCDLPGAGLAWFLTDGDDPRREAAFAAMRERHGRLASHLVRHLRYARPSRRSPRERRSGCAR
jgi:hypothetical protein